MEPIELKHIAPFLPYDLEFTAVNPDTDKSQSWILLGISSGMAIGLNNEKDTDETPYFDLKDIRPKLLPLFDIVKDNPATGRPYFVDVFATVSAGCRGSNNKFWTYRIFRNTNLDHISFESKYNDHSYMLYDNGDLLIYRNGENDPGDGFINYYRALAQYHFDIDGLIGSGLADEKKCQ